MPTQFTRRGIWALARTERAALAEDLTVLSDEQWRHPSLCSEWDVEHVVAHLTASASVGPVRWIASVIGARFDFDLHNERRLAEQLGATPAETLARFRAIVASTTAAPGPAAAWLGEVVVHAEDVRRPLGFAHAYSGDATTAVAEFYVARNLAVPTRTNAEGLRLKATDGSFAAGEGPLVRGTTLALIMALAGRAVYCDELEGPGVEVLRERVA
jgi:uncharacterized protein (TIGR03083 family)